MTGGGGGGLADRAARAVAGFTSTRSKEPDALFGGPGGPTHLVRSCGATIETADGRTLLDWTMALGAVALGYAHPRVVEAATRAARDGAVGGLPPALEVEVAERLVASYPGAEAARFFKTGAEAVAAAVRLARVATGRDLVLAVGYHGWLDGEFRGAGVPRAVADLWRELPFDDVAALESAFADLGPRVAALLVEPVIEREPGRRWLESVRTLASRHGAVLVLDEIKTGFRLSGGGPGGAARRYGSVPDLAVFGKALGNGFPLAALLGRSDLMGRVRDTWISSTLATEFVALAAAGAVLDVFAEQDVPAHLGRIGALVMDGLARCLAARRTPARVRGIPEMWFVEFEPTAGDLERRFLLGCAERGVLLKRGPYNFPSLGHGEAEVERTLEAVDGTLAELGR